MLSVFFTVCYNLHSKHVVTWIAFLLNAFLLYKQQCPKYVFPAIQIEVENKSFYSYFLLVISN